MARLLVLRDLGKSYATRLIDDGLARLPSMKTTRESMQQARAKQQGGGGRDAPTTSAIADGCSRTVPPAPNPYADHDDLGAAARAELQRADAALLASLRPHGVGDDLAVSMRFVRMVTSALRADGQRPPLITNAIFLVEKAARIVSMLNLIDAMGTKVDGDLDDHLHGLVAAASRLLSGFVTKGKRDWKLLEGDTVFLCHRAIERNHAAYLNGDATARCAIEKKTLYAITEVTGQQPELNLVREALSVPFRKGAPRRGTRGRLSVLVDILKAAKRDVSVNGARGMISRAEAKEERL